LRYLLKDYRTPYIYTVSVAAPLAINGVYVY
jgi:hypothetical protein